MPRLPALPWLLVASLFLTGCAGQGSLSGTFARWFGQDDSRAATAPKPVAGYSGFLKDYSGLQEVTFKDGRKTFRWVSPALARSQYKYLYIEPVVYYPAARPGAGVDRKLVTEVTRYLGLKVAHQLRGGRIQVVDKPVPGALHWRAAITRTEARAKRGRVASLPPIALVAGGVTGPAHPDKQVTVYLESELTDHDSGKVLARSVKPDVSTLALASPDQVVGFEDVRPVLDLWAADAQRFAEKGATLR